MKENPNKKLPTELALVFLLFILPGFLALLVFQHPQWLNGKTTNNGKLISPLIKLEGLKQNKWHLLLVSNQICDSSCITLLDKLARVRLALGRLSREVDLRLMVSNAAFLPNESILGQMKDLAITTQVLSLSDKKNLLMRNYLNGLFIVDPRNNLVLSYPLNAQQKSIYKDLKHLLKVSER